MRLTRRSGSGRQSWNCAGLGWLGDATTRYWSGCKKSYGVGGQVCLIFVWPHIGGPSAVLYGSYSCCSWWFLMSSARKWLSVTRWGQSVLCGSTSDLYHNTPCFVHAVFMEQRRRTLLRDISTSHPTLGDQWLRNVRGTACQECTVADDVPSRAEDRSSFDND